MHMGGCECVCGGKGVNVRVWGGGWEGVGMGGCALAGNFNRNVTKEYSITNSVVCVQVFADIGNRGCNFNIVM
jgi:hypothetical protein